MGTRVKRRNAAAAVDILFAVAVEIVIEEKKK